ncbi:galactose-1-epimerase [Phenylobacterium deserti]|uniref:Aldose 1-epimerase n=2 Tax=Phenylobacterium deserti TaxID=1914756 RepID=A0A328AH81_9CAUL|nr:galactose-1-epimerase [Phenylobacterium deserti]
MSLGLRAAALASVAVLAAAPVSAGAVELARKPFGRTPDGAAVEAITLTARNGVSATVITYGATLQALVVPDRAGKPADVVLGFSDAEGYAKAASYFGATIGRYANRIGGGRFSLDGKSYQLARNDHDLAALHGGKKGWDKVVWQVTDASAGPVASVRMSYVSPDGEEGYPGKVTATATYALSEAGELTITYGATTDRPTIISMTNHALFNMAGEGAPGGALGNVLTIEGDRYTPVDAALIPTGELTPVAGTPFDFRRPRVVAERIREASDPQIVLGRGYDHNYVLNGGKTAKPRLIARLADPASGRTLEVLSDQPGVQFYAGNFLDGTLVGKSGRAYRQGDGIALEPQIFPDTPNKPAFGSARLAPGQTYTNTMVFRVSAGR